MTEREPRPYVGNVTDLNRHVPAELRELAKAAYMARRRFRDAERANAAAMVAFTQCCNKFGLAPDSLQVGELSGASLASAVYLAGVR